MADNKQYITTNQENGAIMISEDVIAAITTHALSEVEGVVSVVTKPGADIVELIGKKGKGIKINLDDDGALTIDCSITILYGQSVVEVASAAQQSVANAISSMTGINIKAVNVNVCGIARQ